MRIKIAARARLARIKQAERVKIIPEIPFPHRYIKLDDVVAVMAKEITAHPERTIAELVPEDLEDTDLATLYACRIASARPISDAIYPMFKQNEDGTLFVSAFQLNMQLENTIEPCHKQHMGTFSRILLKPADHGLSVVAGDQLLLLSAKRAATHAIETTTVSTVVALVSSLAL